MARRQFAPEIEAAIDRAAQRTGLPREVLRMHVSIESAGNPRLVNKYGYGGLLQLQPGEHQRLGGSRETWLDPDANLTTGAVKIKQNWNFFKNRYGRDPTPGELYLLHQQGPGGAPMHWANPDRPAWQNMLATGEGRQKGEDWARRAIWDNVPNDVKQRYGSVDNLTSRDFVKLWEAKVASHSGMPATAPSSPPVPSSDPSSPAPTQVAGAGAVPQQPATGTSATPTPTPTTVAAASSQPSPGGFGADIGDPVAFAAGVAGRVQAEIEDTAKDEANLTKRTAEAKAARPPLPGPSPMIQGPRTPKVDMRDLLAVLKASGINPDMAGGLGTGTGKLGTRIG